MAESAGSYNFLLSVLKSYKQGLDLTLLAPNSKRPIHKNWTTAGKLRWKEFKKAYRPGNNVGCRLGVPVEIEGDGKYFLGVIDFDIKSSSPEDREIAKRALTAIIGKDRVELPDVITGRGNGSGHYYVISRSMIEPKRLAQAPNKVKVLMPGKEPSNADKRLLSAEDIKAGYRMRAAWEISVMGKGQQVVIPPSIHPDTGKKYRWRNGGIHLSELPILETLGVTDTLNKPDEGIPPPPTARDCPVYSEKEESDLDALPEKLATMIREGDERTLDRSQGLYLASVELLNRGFSESDVLGFLTIPGTHLGDTGYDQTGSESRVRAAKWVWKYTVRPANRKAGARYAFEAIPGGGEPENASDSILDAMESGIDGHKYLLTNTPKADPGAVDPLGDDEAEDWQDTLEREREGGRPKTTYRNTLIILAKAMGKNPFARNVLTDNLEFVINCPWGKRGEAINDRTILHIREWFANTYRIEPDTRKIHEATIRLGEKQSYDPIRDYLDALPEWDGKERINTWLRTYLGAVGPEPYLTDVSRKFLVAMVARALTPGCKFDTVMILEGDQGTGKSTALNILGGEWFSDTALNIGDKDAILSIRRNWLIELGELSGMRKVEVDTLKEFISRRIDSIRVPYGRITEDYPRRSVFVGTTNPLDPYLKDQTGNRRFWPVETTKIDLQGLREDRDQLFAEALVWFDLGETLYLDKESTEQAKAVQNERVETDDVGMDTLAGFLRDTPGAEKAFTMKEFFDAIGMSPASKADQMRFGRVARLMGYENTILRDKNSGRIVRKYVLNHEKRRFFRQGGQK